jgi:hypothetical protein
MDNLCKICKSDTSLLFKLELLSSSFIYNMKNVNIVSCSNCGFCFNNKISQEDCNNYYSNSTNYSHSLYKTQPLQHDRYNYLKDLLPKLNINSNDSIIDLTASDGSLLTYLQHIGYNNITYCDISQTNIDNCEFNNKYKLNLFEKNDYHNINKKYKFIILSHTLEHISDLQSIFDNIKLLMDDDSFLYIEVPDINRIKCDKNAFLELSYEHINLFNSTSLNNLCLKNNLINCDLGILEFYYRINILVKAVYGVYKVDNSIINKDIICDTNTQTNLIQYIDDSRKEFENLYNQIDKTKTYSVVGSGSYSTYFLTMYKDIKVNCFYDEVKSGKINGIEVKSFTDINENENILILTPHYYNHIYNKLIKININPQTIVPLKF